MGAKSLDRCHYHFPHFLLQKKYLPIWTYFGPLKGIKTEVESSWKMFPDVFVKE